MKTYYQWWREGIFGCLLQWSPKFFNNVFLFASLTTVGTFYWILIGWFIKFMAQTFQPLILFTEGVILCIIIGYARPFISHNLNPLDPWIVLVVQRSIKLTFPYFSLPLAFHFYPLRIAYLNFKADVEIIPPYLTFNFLNNGGDSNGQYFHISVFC